jgi:hypothetical protein
MPSQKLRGWLSKNFVLQGLVIFQGYVEVLKNRRNAVGRTFCDAITFNSAGEQEMELDLDLLDDLISNRIDEIEKSVAGTGYLPRTVIGVGTFLLDNEGNVDLLTAKQRVTFERFLKPLLEAK